MELDAFTNRLGLGQGRLATAAGGFEFILGDLEPGRWANLLPGDRVGVSQDVDLSATDLIRLQGVLRVPPSLPSGFAWEVSLLVDGATMGRTRGRAGRERVLTDVTANVSAFSGTHQVEVRLELVTV